MTLTLDQVQSFLSFVFVFVGISSFLFLTIGFLLVCTSEKEKVQKNQQVIHQTIAKLNTSNAAHSTEVSEDVTILVSVECSEPVNVSIPQEPNEVKKSQKNKTTKSTKHPKNKKVAKEQPQGKNQKKAFVDISGVEVKLYKLRQEAVLKVSDLLVMVPPSVKRYKLRGEDVIKLAEAQKIAKSQAPVQELNKLAA